MVTKTKRASSATLPVQLGRLEVKVESLEERLDRHLSEQNKQLDRLNDHLEKLTAMSNRWRGGVLTLLAIGGILGGTLGVLVNHILMAIKGV